MDHLCRSLLLFLLLPVTLLTQADVLKKKAIPEQLKPWTAWVLQHEESYGCPFFFNNFQQKHCAWSGQLSLALQAKQGDFKVVWSVFNDSWVALPGDRKHWPQNVTINNQPAVVNEQKGRPAVFLSPGEFTISGQFFWDRIPDNLTIPETTGLLNLSIADNQILFPSVKRGSLWLKDNESAHKKTQNEQNKLDIQVFRKVLDDVPMQLMTFIELEVSGDQREVSLPHALLKDFIPVALNSPLPARLEADGSLLLQVRPGRWRIELNARHPNQLSQLSFAVSNPDWPAAEIWAFQAMPYQRLVKIQNLAAIDPSQTNVPGQWRSFPAYQIKQGETMSFKVIRRGDPEPEPNQLRLQRKLWLDFDGSGYTVEDQISGKMTQGWRLDAQPEMRLGQAKINDQNQLITRLKKDGPNGLEVRKGALQLSADSRIEKPIDHLNAVGWQQDFHQVRAELNIPPGWRLLAASGVDNDPDSWISRWTLLDLFLVLIAALATSRLWTIYWGFFTLLSLTLIWHEPEAPRLVWLNLLAAIALLRVLPEGRFLLLIKSYRNLCWLALVLITIPFMVSQVRVGLYPQLEKQWQPITTSPYQTHAAIQQESQLQEDVATLTRKTPAKMRSNTYASPASMDEKYSVNFDRIDPDAKIQTGPGLPQWQWHSVQLSWNGRVHSDQQIELWYLSPAMTMALNFIRVTLVMLLSLLMFGMLNNKFRLSMPVLSIVLLVLLGTPTNDAYAAFPSQKLLNELKSRLLQAPDCLPTCAQIAAMHLQIDDSKLQIYLQIHTQQDSAVPLPAHFNLWQPAFVSVNGENAASLIRQQDQLWLYLPKGQHNVILKGINPPTHQFTLPLPLQPHRVTADSQGWTIEGLHEDGRSAGQLQFTRLKTLHQQQTTASLQQTTLPAFIRIERTLHLGLDWRIDTRVIRAERSGAPVILEFPLLTGESVTSANVRVVNERVLVNMPAGQQVTQWQSVLAKSERIELSASPSTDWTEVWRAEISPTWHLETTGIAVVHHQDQQGRWLPEWRPWQNETVQLHITRPQAVPGDTLTIDKSEMRIKPGKRSLEAEMELQIRSSKGEQHTLKLPEKAILQAVKLDGVTQPIRQQGYNVTIPLKPGTQSVSLSWHENKEQAYWLTTPRVNLGISSVNSHIKVISGQDRWILFTMGPKFGPAALIWGVLIVLTMLSIGLGKISLTPLKHWHWFLLLVGLSQIPVAAGALVVIWLFALGLRAKHSPANSSTFNLLQIALGGLTVISLMLLFYAVQQGLLGSPDMQIAGNQSSAYHLNWYQDRNSEWLPTATVISAPLLLYRVLMLLWSLWLAVSLLNWLKWGWQCYSNSGIWKKTEKTKDKTTQPAGTSTKDNWT
jgi:hypothetical protein